MTNTLDLSCISSISGPYHLSVVLSEGSLRLHSTDPSDELPGILCEKGKKSSNNVFYF